VRTCDNSKGPDCREAKRKREKPPEAEWGNREVLHLNGKERKGFFLVLEGIVDATLGKREKNYVGWGRGEGNNWCLHAVGNDEEHFLLLGA